VTFKHGDKTLVGELRVLINYIGFLGFISYRVYIVSNCEP
jgi:hypothetical protein